MCFVPIISISTAFIEFFIAIFILFYFKKTPYKNTSLIFILFLGLYQLSEYLLCSTSNPFLWAKLGFITYTFLPALALKIVLEILDISKTKKIFNNIKIFFFPIMFSIFALVKDDFISTAICDKYFILVYKNFFENYHHFLNNIYILYYFGTILILLYLLIKGYKKKNQSKKNKKIIFWFFLAFIIGLIPPIILLFIFPIIFYKFPSIYCQFSLLTTFCLIWIFYLEKKLK